MKKFFKWSGIVAGIMLTVGLVILFASTVMGGRHLFIRMSETGLTRAMLREILDELDLDDFYRFVRAVDGVKVKVGEDNVQIDIGNAGNAGNAGSTGNAGSVHNGEKHESGIEEVKYLTKEVKKMKLHVGAGKLILQQKDIDDGNIDLIINGIGNCKHHINKEGELVVDVFHNRVGIVDTTVNEIILKVPQGKEFIEIDIVAGAGQIEISDIHVRELETEIGAGELNLSRVTAAEFSANIGAGKMDAAGWILMIQKSM